MKINLSLLFFAASISWSVADEETERLISEYEAKGWIESDTDVQSRVGDFAQPGQFKHHNYIKLVEFLNNLSKGYPHLTHLYSIGRSVLGRELLVIAIGRSPAEHLPGIPEFKYVANMHGNEVTGRELLLTLAEVLLVNYGKNLYLTRLVNTTRIHILPTMNPDGYERAIEGDYDSITGRGNTRNVDLNRDFPHRLGGGQRRAVQPETDAVMRWTRSIPFVLSANLHDGSSLVNYPYDDGTDGNNGRSRVSRTPDHELFVRLAYTYARAHKFMWKKGPRCLPDWGSGIDPTSGITNGAEWYPVSGGMQDWNYVNTNCFEVTVEMNCQKFTYAKDLARLWDEHKSALIVYLEQVHNTLSGFITDSVTGAGISNATISITDDGKLIKSYVYGDYWRLLNPGEYLVTFDHASYMPVTRRVSITREQPYAFLNVTMQRRGIQSTPHNNTNRFTSSASCSLVYCAPFVTISLLAHSANLLLSVF